MSLNETVVVLDRIREVMRKYKRMPTDCRNHRHVRQRGSAAHDHDLDDNVLLALFWRWCCSAVNVIRSFSLAMTCSAYAWSRRTPPMFICSPLLIYLGVRDAGVETGSEAEHKPGKAPA
jgi:preprotein translocase subunit SecF